MQFTHFLNFKRLRDYPRLMLVVVIFILLFNVLLGNGWMGAMKQIYGGDFIMLYSGGIIYRSDINRLYDFQYQGEIQKGLISPTPLWGIMPFNYPPYVAWAISKLTVFPLPLAFIIWVILTITTTFLAVYWLYQNITPEWLKQSGLTFPQLSILTFSFFPFVEGLLVGQNHGITLLLITGIVIFTLREQWYLVGLLTGLTIYKPQFAIGFLIIWIVWRKYKAIAAFLATSGMWVGLFILENGFKPIQTYLSIIPTLLKMPYLEGFGGYLEVTLYGFLITVLPKSWWQGIFISSQLLTILLGMALAVFAYIKRKEPVSDQKPVLMLAILYPLLVAPHTLLHDLIILIPLFMLWSNLERSRKLLNICISVYLLTFVLPPITHATGIAFLGLIPVILTITLVRQSKIDWAKAWSKNSIHSIASSPRKG